MKRDYSKVNQNHYGLRLQPDVRSELMRQAEIANIKPATLAAKLIEQGLRQQQKSA